MWSFPLSVPPANAPGAPGRMIRVSFCVGLAAALVLVVAASSEAQEKPAPAAAASSPAAPPPAAPPKPPERLLAEKLAALSDPAFTTYLQSHPEDLTQPDVAAFLRLGREAGMHGDNDEQGRLFARAGQMADASGDRVSQARVLWRLAAMEAEFHHADKALPMIDRAIDMATAAEAPVRDLAGMYGTRIVTYGIQGDYVRAMAGCDHALQLAGEGKNPDAAMAVLTTLINIYQRQGQPERSLPYLEQARQVAAGNDHMLLYVDGNYSATYHQLGDLDKTREYLGRALDTARRLEDTNMTAAFLTSAGEYAIQAKDFPAAAKVLDEARALAEKTGNDHVKVDAALQTGELAQAQGRREDAETAARTAVAGARETGELESASRAQDLLGRALADAGRKDEAIAAFRGAIDTIEQLRADAAGSEDSVQAMLQHHIDPYQRLVGLLVAAGHTEEAFAVAENSKARVLRDILQGGRLDLAGVLTDEERQRRTTAGNTLAAANRQFQQVRGSGGDPAAISNAQTGLDAARLAARNLDDGLLAAHPEVRRREALSQAGGSAILPAICAADTLFLEYVIGPEQTTLFVAGPGKEALEAHVLPGGTDALRGRVEEFRASLAERSLHWREAAGSLGRDLLGPVADGRLARASRVIVVPDGPLWDLPFQVLRRDGEKKGAGGDCLIDRVTVSYAPSAAFLDQVGRDKEGKQPPGGKNTRLLAMGNPALGGDAASRPAAALMGGGFAPLPSATEEVRKLGDLYGQADSALFVGEAATEKVFKERAGEFNILHLATHGLLNDANPLYSCLLMAQTNLGPGEDGLLEAREIMELRLHARLAILAACETARGKAGAGEGQLGLSWALMVAGCPASVVSQWKVDSRSNVELMLELHRQLRAGKGTDEALREASLALRKKPGYENPFYWAPFVVVGDGR